MTERVGDDEMDTERQYLRLSTSQVVLMAAAVGIVVAQRAHAGNRDFLDWSHVNWRTDNHSVCGVLDAD